MHGRRHRHHFHHGFGPRFGRRIPSREQLLAILEERQKDLEEEIADIHDLIHRLRDADSPARAGGAADPRPAI